MLMRAAEDGDFGRAEDSTLNGNVDIDWLLVRGSGMGKGGGEGSWRGMQRQTCDAAPTGYAMTMPLILQGNELDDVPIYVGAAAVPPVAPPPVADTIPLTPAEKDDLITIIVSVITSFMAAAVK